MGIIRDVSNKAIKLQTLHIHFHRWFVFSRIEYGTAEARAPR